MSLSEPGNGTGSGSESWPVLCSHTEPRQALLQFFHVQRLCHMGVHPGIQHLLAVLGKSVGRQAADFQSCCSGYSRRSGKILRRNATLWSVRDPEDKGHLISPLKRQLVHLSVFRKSVLKELVLGDIQRILSYVKAHDQQFTFMVSGYDDEKATLVDRIRGLARRAGKGSQHRHGAPGRCGVLRADHPQVHGRAGTLL